MKEEMAQAALFRFKLNSMLLTEVDGSAALLNETRAWESSGSIKPAMRPFRNRQSAILCQCATFATTDLKPPTHQQAVFGKPICVSVLLLTT